MKLVSLLLLVFVTLANGCGSPSGDTVVSQKDAHEAIMKLGGVVELDDSNEVNSVRFSEIEITDADLEQLQLKELTSLQHLILAKTKITDAGLVHLKGMTNLKKLDLRSTQVTNAGLKHLKGLANLESLQLYGTKVTNVGVKDIKAALPKCNISR